MFLQVSVCPRGGTCSRGCLAGGAWSRGGLVPGGSGPGGVLSRGVCLVETPPDGYCCGRHASYWNAFLFGSKNSGICGGLQVIFFLLDIHFNMSSLLLIETAEIIPEGLLTRTVFEPISVITTVKV